MKTLILMRHAKSTWKEKKVDDYDRPLSKRGKKDAPRMGELLKEHNLLPDLIIASTSVRTHETVDLVIEASRYRGNICLFSDLYMGEIDVYFTHIRQLSDEVNTLLVIGHNPSLESILQLLTGKVESLPSGAVAHIQLPVDCWKDLNFEQTGTLVNFWKPKEID